MVTDPRLILTGAGFSSEVSDALIRQNLVGLGQVRFRIPPRRGWAPELLVEDLRALPALAPNARVQALKRMEINAPLVYRYLRIFVRKYFGYRGRTPMSFLGLIEVAGISLRPEDHPRISVTENDLRALLSVLIDIGVIRRLVHKDKADSERTRYEPDWEHPFCRAAIADIPKKSAGAYRGAWHRCVQALHATGANQNTAASAAGTAPTKERH